VIPHGIPPGFRQKDPDSDVLDRFSLPSRFLFSVSNVARYKNQVELVRGYAAADATTEMPPLYLAGKTVDRSYANKLASCIENHKLTDKIHRMGYVDRSFLPDIHAASMGFVFSSACENAPISILEAMGCGAPIVCSDAASMPEMCDDAAIYFDPYDPTDIAEKLISLVTDDARRERLACESANRAGRYSWAKAAAQTEELFRNVLTDRA
jgi:glycosyltransferase involved in cell wall biosynthesis